MKEKFDLKNFVSRETNVDEILSRSSRAVCGAFEREVSVKSERVSMIKQRLKSKGFVIIGTSEPIGRTKKIWFIPAGASL